MASSMDTDAQQSQFSTSKRPRAYSENSTGALQHDDYTIGWISALPLEMTAAEIMLDHIHQPLPQHHQDGNTYTLGSINDHNVVITCLPKGQYGTNNAATIANDMARSFPHIQHCLMVGIGGGAPKLADVRLGDVVISTEVVQSDMGKMIPNDQFQRTSHPVRPPHSLMTAVSKLQASHNRGQNHMSAILSEGISQLTQYVRPSMLDRLFRNDYHHHHSSEDCNFCDQSQLVTRPTRQNTDPVIHYGRIASGNQVIKDARIRDNLSDELGVICFEMEAAGLMNSSPCLVVRGICDYSDSHKNKKWQEYAAIAAAAYAKELLTSIPPQSPQHWMRRNPQRPKASESISPEAEACLRAMFVTDSSLDREDILDTKGDICKGTCEWILSTDKFQAWDQNPPHLLWISAPPGMGKTYMSVYLSKQFESLSNALYGVTTIFFFCDNNVQTRNTAVNILRSLMYQLISHQRSLINTIIPQWRQLSLQLFQESSFGTLWKLFEDIIAQSCFRTIYCVIDALDECEANSLSFLLRKFERLSQGYSNSSAKLKLVCLSRRYPEKIPEALLQFKKMELDAMPARNKDIRRFVALKALELSQKKRLSHETRYRLQETFLRKSQGTFLWVGFMAHDLGGKRLLDFEASLEMLPAGLDAVYERILQRIDFENNAVIQGILYWIVVAMRPLTIPELCEAVDLKSTGFLTREQLCIELIESCGHLLQITDVAPQENYISTHSDFDVMSEIIFEPESGKYNKDNSYSHSLQDKRTQTVTFLHQSAKDYLITFRRRFGSQIPGLAHPQLHELASVTLIQYLEKISSHAVNQWKESEDTANYLPLTNYAVENWHLHFKELEDTTQVMKQCAIFFGKDSKVRHTWQKLYDFNEAGQESPPIPLLHLSAILALNNLAEWCLKRDGEHDIESEWFKQTALIVAIEMRQDYIATLLLDAGADAVGRGSSSMNALEMAVSYCNKHVLKHMAQSESCSQWLKWRVSMTDCGLLDRAIVHGNVDACRFLIEDLGWDLDWQDGTFGRSALTSALRGGHFELAGVLIKEYNVLMGNHSEILQVAVSSGPCAGGFKQLVRFLVDHCAVDINATDKEGHNALCATFNHHSSDPFHAKTLLEFGCNPDQPDRQGRTPFHCLAKGLSNIGFSRFPDYLQLLVSKSERGINQVCSKGQTVLHHLMETSIRASYLESEPEAVKVLLDLGADRHIRNSEGLTALEIFCSAAEPSKEKFEVLGEFFWKALNQVIELLQDYSTVPKPCSAMVKHLGKPGGNAEGSETCKGRL
ncbi:PFS domain-containing protein [Fusarium oxysporum f. sp. phaseoli]